LARLVVDPWSGRLVLDRSAVPLTSVREKVPLAVTQLMPVNSTPTRKPHRPAGSYGPGEAA
jgi:hypothetical protein